MFFVAPHIEDLVVLPTPVLRLLNVIDDGHLRNDDEYEGELLFTFRLLFVFIYLLALLIQISKPSNVKQEPDNIPLSEFWRFIISQILTARCRHKSGVISSHVLQYYRHDDVSLFRRSSDVQDEHVNTIHQHLNLFRFVVVYTLLHHNLITRFTSQECNMYVTCSVYRYNSGTCSVLFCLAFGLNRYNRRHERRMSEIWFRFIPLDSKRESWERPGKSCTKFICIINCVTTRD